MGALELSFGGDRYLCMVRLNIGGVRVGHGIDLIKCDYLPCYFVVCDSLVNLPLIFHW